MFGIYQSLPKQIEAVQFTEENKNIVFNSLTGQSYIDFENGLPVIKVKTMHGDTAIIRFTDWIAKDSKIGTYYPIKDEVFKKCYV